MSYDYVRAFAHQNMGIFLFKRRISSITEIVHKRIAQLHLVDFWDYFGCFSATFYKLICIIMQFAVDFSVKKYCVFFMFFCNFYSAGIVYEE